VVPPSERVERPVGQHLDRRLALADDAGDLVVAEPAEEAQFEDLALLDQVFARNQRAERIDGRQLGRDLNLSQTANGFTVTVGRVYADANEIVIGYTATGPPGRDYAYIAASDATGRGIPTLTDREGHYFPLVPAAIEGQAMTGNQDSSLLPYNAAQITGSPEALTLRWTIEALRVREQSDGPGTSAQIVPGPFVFDFTVPFEAGRTLELNQAVEAGGTTVTLERVVATPVSTRVYLRGAGPSAQVTLTAGGTTYTLREETVPSNWTPDSSWYYSVFEPLLDQPGDWTLVVRARAAAAEPTIPQGGPAGTILQGGHEGYPERTILRGGPWTFRFPWPADARDPR
jgi:hypothetical protein